MSTLEQKITQAAYLGALDANKELEQVKADLDRHKRALELARDLIEFNLMVKHPNALREIDEILKGNR